MPRPASLSDYRWLYKNEYMPDGLKCAREIMPDIIDRCPATFLDYGCGRGHLVDHINSRTSGHATGYDPGNGRHLLDGTYDYVISCDVLEHIPLPDIDGTLALMRDISEYGMLLTIANMSDVHPVNGEPVELHLIQEDAGWWGEKIRSHCRKSHLEIRPICKNGDRFAIIVDYT